MKGLGEKVLNRFYQKIANNPGIDAKHITLFNRWSESNFCSPITIFGASIMPKAKISSSATYFRNLKYLKEAGYINYEPSHYMTKGSKVFLIETYLSMSNLCIPNENDFRRWIREAVKECLENVSITGVQP